MVVTAKNPPNTNRDVLLILGPYDDMVVGFYEAWNESWRERSTDGTADGMTIKETRDCFVAGWMELPDIELWKDKLLGQYEWERMVNDE